MLSLMQTTSHLIDLIS